MSLLRQLSKQYRSTVLKPNQWSRLISSTTTLRSETTPLTFQTSADVSAFIARLKLDKLNPALIYNILERSENVDQVQNGQLRILGLSTLKFFIYEKLLLEYPRLNRELLEKIYKLHFNIVPTAFLARNFGFDKLLTQVENPKDLRFQSAKSFLSLIGAIYQQEGPLAARDFIHNYIAPRNMKLDEILDFNPPKVLLSQMIQKQGKPTPITRLLKESGRLSNRPVFIVGVFSGTEKLCEGYGSSLKMAEFRACRNYLVNYFSEKRIDYQLPSDIQSADSSYQPAPLEPTPPVL